MLTLSLLALSFAAPADAGVSSGATVLTGIGATFDGDPATFKLQVQAELALMSPPVLGLGLVLPLELTTSGQDGFGMSTSNSMLTFIPSLRLRAPNNTPIRFYGDAGAGLAQITATRESWLFDESHSRTGWGTRLALGCEIGRADGGVTFVVEPLGFDTVHFGSHDAAGYTGRLGVGVRF